MSGSARILVVDDEEPIRRSLARLLGRAGHDCATAADAAEATRLLALEHFDLALTDVNMPGDSGLVLAQRIIDDHPDTAVVMVTGVDDTGLAAVALEVGAYGYVIKPFEANEILINVANALRRRSLEIENRMHRERLEDIVAQRTASLTASLQELAAADAALRRSHEQAIDRLARAAEYHDATTGVHLRRMSLYSQALARAIGLPEDRCEMIRVASPMHDIGKIGIPDEILRKPGRLTPEDIVVMQEHPRIGYELLTGSDSELLELGAVIALSHHERYDGSGYPSGLVGDQIALEGRIVALADVFDALTSVRPYKAAMAFDDALDLVVQDRGRHFDPWLVDAFVAIRADLLAIALAHADPKAAVSV